MEAVEAAAPAADPAAAAGHPADAARPAGADPVTGAIPVPATVEHIGITVVTFPIGRIHPGHTAAGPREAVRPI